MSGQENIDMKPSIQAKSNQINADDLVGGAMTITITSVKQGSAEQPIIIHYDGDNGKPLKPCKTVCRILVAAWGDEGSQYVGKSMTLYNDPSVKWGGDEVGGIRVSHLSHIDKPIRLSLTVTRGRRKPTVIQPLVVKVPVEDEPIDANAPLDHLPTHHMTILLSSGANPTFADGRALADWLKTNLPKLSELAQLEAFEERNKANFAEYFKGDPDLSHEIHTIFTTRKGDLNVQL